MICITFVIAGDRVLAFRRVVYLSDMEAADKRSGSPDHKLSFFDALYNASHHAWSAVLSFLTRSFL